MDKKIEKILEVVESEGAESFKSLRDRLYKYEEKREEIAQDLGALEVEQAELDERVLSVHVWRSPMGICLR